MSLLHIAEVGLRSVQTIRYAELASSTIIVFDHIITLDQEIKLIWKSGWSLGKCLFLLNRYYTLAAVVFNNYVLFSDHLTDQVRLNWFRWQGATGVIAFVIGELILQLRLYALYFLDNRVLALMAFTFIGSVISASTLMGISLSQVTAFSHLLPMPFCIPAHVPPNFYSWWIPILISETILCGLALWRGFQSYYSRENIFQSGREIIEILIRDSVLYFLILFAVYLCNTIIFILGNNTQLEAAVGYSIAMSCVMGNRLCLNVRGMIYKDEDMPSIRALAVSRPTRTASFRSKPSVQAVVIGSTNDSGGQLTDIELHELRNMKTTV